MLRHSIFIAVHNFLIFVAPLFYIGKDLLTQMFVIVYSCINVVVLRMLFKSILSKALVSNDMVYYPVRILSHLFWGIFGIYEWLQMVMR